MSERNTLVHDTEPERCDRRLLIVDDESTIRFAFERFLGSAGFAVDCAGEREEAEALLLNIRYDAVILDLRLSPTGPTDGLDLIGLVRHRCPLAKVILLTSYGSQEVQDEASRLGADAYLNKPVSLARVVEILTDLLESGR